MGCGKRVGSGCGVWGVHCVSGMSLYPVGMIVVHAVDYLFVWFKPWKQLPPFLYPGSDVLIAIIFLISTA